MWIAQPCLEWLNMIDIHNIYIQNDVNKLVKMADFWGNVNAYTQDMGTWM